MTQRIGRVSLASQEVGTIEEIGDSTRFTYSADWLSHPGAVPVSLTLPLRAEPYTTRGLHPFFENLLPEGWLLEISAQALKVSKDDPIGLLLSTCGDCVGAVEIEPMSASTTRASAT